MVGKCVRDGQASRTCRSNYGVCPEAGPHEGCGSAGVKLRKRERFAGTPVPDISDLETFPVTYLKDAVPISVCFLRR